MAKQSGQRKNPVLGTFSDVSETLRDEFAQEIPKTALKQLGWEKFFKGRPKSNQALNPDARDLLFDEEQTKETPKPRIQEVTKEILIFSAEQRKKEQEIQVRLGQIRTQITSLAKEISVQTTLTVEQEIQKPGVGHLNFFEKLLSAFEKMVKNFKDFVQGKKSVVSATSKTPRGMVSLRQQRKNALSGSSESVGTNYTTTQMG